LWRSARIVTAPAEEPDREGSNRVAPSTYRRGWEGRRRSAAGGETSLRHRRDSPPSGPGHDRLPHASSHRTEAARSGPGHAQTPPSPRPPTRSARRAKERQQSCPLTAYSPPPFLTTRETAPPHDDTEAQDRCQRPRGTIACKIGLLSPTVKVEARRVGEGAPHLGRQFPASRACPHPASPDSGSCLTRSRGTRSGCRLSVGHHRAPRAPRRPSP
jgi:hypothetical protein